MVPDGLGGGLGRNTWRRKVWEGMVLGSRPVQPKSIADLGFSLDRNQRLSLHGFLGCKF